MNNISMQDINTSVCEREMSNHKYRRIVSRFEPLLYVPAFNTMKDFRYNDPARSLSAAIPTTSSLKNSRTQKFLTCSHKNNTREPTSSSRPQPLYNKLPQEPYTTRTRKLAETSTSNSSSTQRKKLCDHF